MNEAILPLPPSTNNLFLTYGRGRAKTHEYKQWQQSAGLILNRARLKAPAPAMVCIRAGRMNARRDLDNLAKPAIDLLVTCGVLADDNVKHVKGVFIVDASDAIPEGFIGVSVAQPSDPFFAPHLQDEII